jgi:hypothetical protein
MKYLRTLTPLFVVFLFTTCVNNPETSNLETNKIEIKSGDLIGKWNQVNTEEALKDSKVNIESIQFNENDSAEISITDSLGSRKIVGEWKYGYKKEIGTTNLSVSVESDIQINFDLTENHRYKILLKLIEDNNKIVMTGHKFRFEKD